jgi:hypothetical protein
MKTLIFTYALVLVAVCKGLAQTNAIVPPAGSTLINLTNLIASADQIIVTNIHNGFDLRRRSFGLAISGDEARKIVTAVTAARLLCFSCTDTAYCSADELQFYRGGHLLAAVHWVGSSFVLGDVQTGAEYYDDSGVLMRFYLNCVEREDHDGQRP